MIKLIFGFYWDSWDLGIDRVFRGPNLQPLQRWKWRLFRDVKEKS